MPDDRELVLLAANDLALLARLLNVDPHLEQWAADVDPVSGGIAADALDQARGLLEELSTGRATEILDAVERLAASLPPPME